MDKIITDLELLTDASEPLTFITDTGFDTVEGLEIIGKLKEALETDKNLLSIAAPQLGIKKRIFCIKFNDVIKTFINPIITKKSNFAIKPETFSSMPGKEILIMRPEEVTVVYYTDEFKYEENKLLGPAARIFDQNAQLLDGVIPNELGLVSDVEKDGSLANCTEEDMQALIDFYKNEFVPRKTALLQEKIKDDPEAKKEYDNLLFTEKVITGQAAIVGRSPSTKAQATAALSIKRAGQTNTAYQNAQRAKIANKSRKYKGKRK